MPKDPALQLKSTPTNNKDDFDTRVSITVNHQSVCVEATTPRISLRPVCQQDVPAHQAIWQNPKAMAYFNDGEPKLHKDPASKKAGIINYAQHYIIDAPNSWTKRWERGDPFSLMSIFDRQSGAMIGGISIALNGIHDLQADFAYYIGQSYWGKGYASEAATAVARVVLPAILHSRCTDDMPLFLSGTVHPDNKASEKILKKSGLKHCPEVTKATFNGKEFPRKKYHNRVENLLGDFLHTRRSQAQKPFLTMYQLQKTSSSQKSATNTPSRSVHSIREPVSPAKCHS